MDDMAAKIGEILNDPDSMSQIMQMAQSLGLTSNQGGAENAPPPNYNFSPPTSNPAPPNQSKDISSTLAGLMNSLGGNNNNSNSSPAGAPSFDVGTMMKIQKAMSAFNESNKNVELLRALKPHFGEDRQKKVDDAIKIMQLINMLPLLKESGLFNMLGSDKQ